MKILAVLERWEKYVPSKFCVVDTYAIHSKKMKFCSMCQPKTKQKPQNLFNIKSMRIRINFFVVFLTD